MAKKTKLFYLSSPYSHKTNDVRVERYKQACCALGWLTRHGYVAFSPIAHTAGVDLYYSSAKAITHDNWMAIDSHFLSLADELLILEIDGWRESRGVRAEIEMAARQKKPIQLLTRKPTGRYDFHEFSMCMLPKLS